MYGRRSSRGLAKAWAILLVVLIVAGISAGVLFTQFWPSAPSGPKYTTVVDMTGKAVNVPAPVSKVVVLQSYWAEVACLLGGSDKIVGISKSVKIPSGSPTP
jgi:ABC-type Fe3+-hydroxamate transport system substrate-binding protein